MLGLREASLQWGELSVYLVRVGKGWGGVGVV